MMFNQCVAADRALLRVDVLPKKTALRSATLQALSALAITKQRADIVSA